MELVNVDIRSGKKKFTLELAMKAQIRGRGIALHFV
jgi:hypothetical protein